MKRRTRGRAKKGGRRRRGLVELVILMHGLDAVRKGVVDEGGKARVVQVDWEEHRTTSIGVR